MELQSYTRNDERHKKKDFIVKNVNQTKNGDPKIRPLDAWVHQEVGGANIQ